MNNPNPPSPLTPQWYRNAFDDCWTAHMDATDQEASTKRYVDAVMTAAEPHISWAIAAAKREGVRDGLEMAGEASRPIEPLALPGDLYGKGIDAGRVGCQADIATLINALHAVAEWEANETAGLIAARQERRIEGLREALSQIEHSAGSANAWASVSDLIFSTENGNVPDTETTQQAEGGV